MWAALTQDVKFVIKKQDKAEMKSIVITVRFVFYAHDQRRET